MKESTFKHYSKDEWVTMINNSLKNEDSKSMEWEVLPGLDGLAFAGREDLQSNLSTGLVFNREDWKIGIMISEMSDFSIATEESVEAILLDMDHLVLPNQTYETLPKGLKWYIPFELWNQTATIQKASSVTPDFVKIPNVALIADTPESSTFNEIRNIMRSFQGSCDLVFKLKSGQGSEEKILYFIDLLHKITNWIERENLSREELTWFFDRMHIMVTVHDKFLFESAFLRSMQYVWFNLQKAYGIPYNKVKFTVLIDNNHKETSLADQLIMNTTGVVAGAIAGAETIFIRPCDSIEDKYEYQILARNLQLICKHESRLNAVNDALAGSYAIEHLTAKLTNYIWNRL